MAFNTPARFRMLAGSTGASSYTSIYITTTTTTILLLLLLLLLLLMFIYRGYKCTHTTDYCSSHTTVHHRETVECTIALRTYFIIISWYGVDNIVAASDRHTSTVTSSTVDGAVALHSAAIKSAILFCISR